LFLIRTSFSELGNKRARNPWARSLLFIRSPPPHHTPSAQTRALHLCDKAPALHNPRAGQAAPRVDASGADRGTGWHAAAGAGVPLRHAGRLRRHNRPACRGFSLLICCTFVYRSDSSFAPCARLVDSAHTHPLESAHPFTFLSASSRSSYDRTPPALASASRVGILCAPPVLQPCIRVHAPANYLEANEALAIPRDDGPAGAVRPCRNGGGEMAGGDVARGG
jgi:hypothetical protein